ncbi:hypothetical protein HY732_04070 [Candidatus Uhrbacteria bacterium]|nr:hypothetical protein [Candidatus Uhrbacteria bacterium]
MKKGIRAIITSPSLKRPPVIIFEEAEALQRSKDALHSMIASSSPNTAYIIPTFRASPLPYIAHGNEKVPSFDNFDEKWRLLISRFKKLGVRRIIIGGSTLEMGLSEQTVEGKRVVQYNLCLGTVISILQKEKEFEVELSELAIPQSRSDLMNLRKSIKENE